MIPGTSFAQLTDRITLKNWTDPLDRIEKLSFADGTTLSLADASALGAELFSSAIPISRAKRATQTPRSSAQRNIRPPARSTTLVSSPTRLRKAFRR